MDWRLMHAKTQLPFAKDYFLRVAYASQKFSRELKEELGLEPIGVFPKVSSMRIQQGTQFETSATINGVGELVTSSIAWLDWGNFTYNLIEREFNIRLRYYVAAVLPDVTVSHSHLIPRAVRNNHAAQSNTTGP